MLVILVLSGASAWFAVGISGVGWLASLEFRPYHEDKEDRLDILVRLTTSLACFTAGLMEAGALTGDEIWLAVILNAVGLGTVLALAYSIGPEKLRRGAIKW